MSILAKGAMSVQIDGALTTSSSLAFRMPVKGKLVAVYGAVGTAPVGTDLLVDIHKEGTTIFTTQTNRLTVADGAAEGAAGTVSGIEVPSFAAGDLFLIDVDQVGSGTAGSDLVVTFAIEGDSLA